MKSIHGLTAMIVAFAMCTSGLAFAEGPEAENDKRMERFELLLLLQSRILAGDKLGRIEPHGEMTLKLLETKELPKQSAYIYMNDHVSERRSSLLDGFIRGDKCTQYKVVPDECKPSVLMERIISAKFPSSTGSPGDEGITEGIFQNAADKGD